MSNPSRTALLAAVIAGASASLVHAQTETILSVSPPATAPGSWGARASAFSDVDGDGVQELLIGAPNFGGGFAASVHSGASGAQLFHIVAPSLPNFFGDAVFAVMDENGDGIDEIMSLGSRSGDPSSAPGTIAVYNGSDGALLRNVAVAQGATLQGHSQADAYSPGDLDGDGRGDVLCLTVGLHPAGTSAPVTALSGLTGELIYVHPHPVGLSAGAFTAVSDHDGDDRADYAIATRQGTAGFIEVRSALTGQVIASVPSTGVSHLTNNHEPFLSVADLDGDGLRDLAVGGLFAGFTTVVSSATGATLRDWSTPSFGSRLIEVGDLTGDGHSELIALQAFGDFSAEPFIAALDPVTGAILFEQRIPGLPAGYTGDERVIAIEAPLDPLGFPTFAIQAGPPNELKIQRILPEIGVADCFGAADPSGVTAQLTVRGAPRVQGPSRLSLTLADAQPGGFAAVLFGTDPAVFPIGPANLCVSTTPGLIRLGNLSPMGGATLDLDLAALGAVALEDWTFQGVFRDALLGVRATNAVTFSVTP